MTLTRNYAPRTPQYLPSDVDDAAKQKRPPYALCSIASHDSYEQRLGIFYFPLITALTFRNSFP